MEPSAAVRTEVLTFAFEGRGHRFEGQLAGALERAELGGAIRLRHAVFLGRDEESGELVVLEERQGLPHLITTLADFRLQATRRRALTQRTLAQSRYAEQLQGLGGTLAPGSAVIVLVVEHAWLAMVTDAVAQTGGRMAADELDPGGGDPVAAALTAALRARAGSTPAPTRP
jgi:hypothetical protein